MKPLTPKEITDKLNSIEGWKVVNNQLTQSFKFKDFIETLSTMNKIGEVAESMNHHPEWFNVYNRLDIRLNTHDAGGITNLDFELAAAINAIVSESN